MVAAPLADALHFVGAAEVIAVAVFTEPPALAGGFTSPSARLQRAEPLAFFRPGVRQKQSLAAWALASFGRTAHGAPNPQAARRSRKPERPKG